MSTKHVLVVMIFFLSLSGMAQHSVCQQSKCSPKTLQYIERAHQSKSQMCLSEKYVYKKINQKWYVSAFVKAEGVAYKKTFKDLGVLIGTTTGSIFTIQIPAENVANLASSESIQYLQLDEPVFMNLDSARSDTRVDSVHQGVNLPQAFTGKNVVVGIIDAGFDYSHPTLMDTSGNIFRLKKVWEQKVSGMPPAGFAYGNEISDSTNLMNDGFDVSLFSHGTHVSGISAGSGYGSQNGKYRGIAFESDLVFVGIKPDPEQWTSTGGTNIIDGINYIYAYAASVGKPAVVNLSWGCSMGPHDGTSLFSQAVDQLTGVGKIFVCAAGNNGTDNIHLNKKFTTTDTLIRSFVNFPTVGTEKRTWLDGWGEAGKTYCVKITLFNGSSAGNSTGFICQDGTLHNYTLIGSANDSCFVSIINSASEFNGKPRIFIDLFTKSANRVEVSVKSNSGNLNMWMGYVKDYTGYYGSFAVGIVGQSVGNKDMTVSDFATTHSAIAAAAYASKVAYTNIDGVASDYSTYVAEGNIVPFSSHGPAADSTNKPDIAAPGLSIASGINSYDTTYNAGGANRISVISSFLSPLTGRTYSYAMMMGTSMASPMTSGIIALMLEANPQLTPFLVKGILKETAILDNFTGSIPSQGSYLWGYGKINAYGAVKKTWESVNVNNISNKEANGILYPNPNLGSFSMIIHSKENEPIQLLIYDVTGKAVFSHNYTVTQGINNISVVSKLTPGLYFLKAIDSSGMSTYKLVVE